ncbi:META domain-containing protein [Mycetocola spongiae]|uniref:META domain-containing protein n=1 Tax=Mycetocola spongiae TaxID=2859226 RepID=UPI001CF59CA0|nr:META domain-containing protein [Mycetocola spongiae]UCR88269.1 META domain-containing protein [Mycetocola spongiae]
MGNRWWGLLAAGTLALILSGCAPAPVDAAAVDGEWTLVSAQDSAGALPADFNSDVTLEVADDQVRSTMACNTVTGDLTRTRILSGGGRTEVGCNPDRMSFDERFERALNGVNAAAREGEELVLTGEDGISLRWSPGIDR